MGGVWVGSAPTLCPSCPCRGEGTAELSLPGLALGPVPNPDVVGLAGWHHLCGLRDAPTPWRGARPRPTGFSTGHVPPQFNRVPFTYLKQSREQTDAVPLP